MDLVSARLKMVESQLRPNGVTDERLVAAMAGVPRELFAQAERRFLAYVDDEIELRLRPPSGPRFLLRPMTFGRMVQLLMPERDERVLDVGCASGYSSAVLSRLAKTVVGLESDAGLAAQAETILESLKVRNTKLAVGELPAGYPEGGPYDVILVNGRVGETPMTLLGQLKEHGRLVAVVGDEELARIAFFTRNGAFSVRYAFDAVAPSLPGFAAKGPAFVF